MKKNQLDQIDHIVVVMLENRSFDHMLGYLYTKEGNRSPRGHSFDGLTGKEFNRDSKGNKHFVYPITAKTPYAYYLPLADPGEGYLNTNSQLFGTTKQPQAGKQANMSGFVTNFEYTLGWEKKEKYNIIGNPTGPEIMSCYSPEMLPILSTLAREYAVSDAWFGSAPTETFPNRAFCFMGTSQGYLSDKSASVYTAPSIFAALSKAGISWQSFGYTSDPLMRNSVADITYASNSHFGTFADFQKIAKAGKLASYTFLEPEWGSSGNSQHPNYNVACGEQFLKDIYTALRTSPNWNKTLLVITYDEHGGCYDHVPPPENAVNPENYTGEFGFNFKRFGPRVPTVFVSPLIEAGTVIRAEGETPFDHTSLLKTIGNRFKLAPLTPRDAAAPCFSDVLTRKKPRTDDPLKNVAAPPCVVTTLLSKKPTHLQQMMVEHAHGLPVKPAKGNGWHNEPQNFKTGKEAMNYVNKMHKAAFRGKKG